MPCRSSRCPVVQGCNPVEPRSLSNERSVAWPMGLWSFSDRPRPSSWYFIRSRGRKSDAVSNCIPPSSFRAAHSTTKQQRYAKEKTLKNGPFQEGRGGHSSKQPSLDNQVGSSTAQLNNLLAGCRYELQIVDHMQALFASPAWCHPQKWGWGGGAKKKASTLAKVAQEVTQSTGWQDCRLSAPVLNHGDSSKSSCGEGTQSPFLVPSLLGGFGGRSQKPSFGPNSPNLLNQGTQIQIQPLSLMNLMCHTKLSAYGPR